MVGSATFTIVASIMSIRAPVIITAAAIQCPEDPVLPLIRSLHYVERCSITNTVLTWTLVLVKWCSLLVRCSSGTAGRHPATALAAAAGAGRKAAPGSDQPRRDRRHRDPAAGRRGARRAQHAADSR